MSLKLTVVDGYLLWDPVLTMLKRVKLLQTSARLVYNYSKTSTKRCRFENLAKIESYSNKGGRILHQKPVCPICLQERQWQVADFDGFVRIRLGRERAFLTRIIDNR